MLLHSRTRPAKASDVWLAAVAWLIAQLLVLAIVPQVLLTLVFAGRPAALARLAGLLLLLTVFLLLMPAFLACSVFTPGWQQCTVSGMQKER